jgi:hypothetical protein
VFYGLNCSERTFLCFYDLSVPENYFPLCSSSLNLSEKDIRLFFCI